MFKLLPGNGFGLRLAFPENLAGCERHVFENRQMRERIPLLKNDADLLAQLFQVRSTTHGHRRYRRRSGRN